MMTISPGLSVVNNELAHPGQEDLAIDGTIEEARRAIPSRRSAAMKVIVFQRPKGAFPNPATARSPPSKRRHVGLGPGFIDKDQALGIDASLMLPPLFTPALDVFAILLLCGGGFFMAQPFGVQELPD